MVTEPDSRGSAPQPEVLGPPETPGRCDGCGREDAAHCVRVFPEYNRDAEDVIDMDLCDTCLAFYRRIAALPPVEAARLEAEREERLTRICEAEEFEEEETP
jgi:hypothetical protein